MKAMLVKERIDFRSSTLVILIFPVIYLLVRLGFSFFAKMSDYAYLEYEATFFSYLMVGICGISQVQKDIDNRFYGTAAAMPIKRSTYVVSYYLFNAMLMVCLMVFETVLTFISCLGSEKLDVNTLLCRLLIGPGVGMMPGILLIPMVLSLINLSKGARAAAGGVIGGIMGAAGSIMLSDGSILNVKGALIFFTVTVVLTVLSCLFSIHIFKRKDISL